MARRACGPDEFLPNSQSAPPASLIRLNGDHEFGRGHAAPELPERASGMRASPSPTMTAFGAVR